MGSSRPLLISSGLRSNAHNPDIMEANDNTKGYTNTVHIQYKYTWMNFGQTHMDAGRPGFASRSMPNAIPLYLTLFPVSLLSIE